MHKENKNQAELLNSLIDVNNDRINGYRDAITWIAPKNNVPVQGYFELHRDQSIQFNAALKPLVSKDDIAVTENENSIDSASAEASTFKSLEAEIDTKEIITYCENLEVTLKKTYEYILLQQDILEPKILALVQSQFELQLKALTIIQALQLSLK